MGRETASEATEAGVGIERSARDGAGWGRATGGAPVRARLGPEEGGRSGGRHDGEAATRAGRESEGREEQTRERACFLCGTTIAPGARQCQACGTGQSAAAQAAIARAVRLRREGGGRGGGRGVVRRHPRAAAAVAAGALVALGFLVGANVVLPSRTALERWEANEGGAAPEERLPLTVLNTSFVAKLREDLGRLGVPLAITGWEFARDSSLVLLLNPPVAGDTASWYWQRLAPRDRGGVLGLISVGYSKAWMQGGHPLDVRAHGHPVVTLMYAYPRVPLAQRGGDGRLYVCPSPFDPRPPGTPLAACALPWRARGGTSRPATIGGAASGGAANGGEASGGGGAGG